MAATATRRRNLTVKKSRKTYVLLKAFGVSYDAYETTLCDRNISNNESGSRRLRARVANSLRWGRLGVSTSDSADCAIVTSEHSSRLRRRFSDSKDNQWLWLQTMSWNNQIPMMEHIVAFATPLGFLLAQCAPTGAIPCKLANAATDT